MRIPTSESAWMAWDRGRRADHAEGEGAADDFDASDQPGEEEIAVRVREGHEVEDLADTCDLMSEDAKQAVRERTFV